MSLKRDEEAHEFLVDLERTRAREHDQRVLLEGLLDGLRVLSQPISAEEMLGEIIRLLRDGLNAEHVFVLEGHPDEDLRVAAFTSPVFKDSRWPNSGPFRRALDGQVGLVFDVGRIPEWREQDPALRAAVTSALLAPLQTYPSPGILVCTHPGHGFFTRSHAGLVERFAPLAAQAILSARARETERREQEAVAAHSVARQRLDLLEHATGAMGIGVAIWTKKRGLTSSSPELEKMLRDWGDANEWWDRALGALEDQTMEVCSTCGEPTRSGSRVITLEAGSGMKGVFRITFAGHVHGIPQAGGGEVVLIADVTELRQTREDADSFRSFFKENPNPVMRATRDGRLLFVNRACRPLLEPCKVVEAGILRGDLHDALRMASDTQTIQEVEVQCAGRTISLLIRPLLDSDELNLYGRDVTEARRISDALRVNEERTREIIDSAFDAIVTMGDKGEVTGWNRRAEEMFGWTTQEALGHLMGDLIVPERFRNAHASGLAHFLETGEGPVIGKPIEVAAKHRDGHEFPVELAIRAIKSGELHGGYIFSGFVRDLTEQKNTEAELAAARESEIAVGSGIQEMFLRGEPPEGHPGLEIGVFSLPSMRLEGDFIDFLAHGERQLDILVGDVMGKGVAAALLGAATKSQFVRSLAHLQSSLGRLPQPQEIVGSVHDAVAGRLIELESFATALYSRFDLDAGVVHFVDCGHPKMIHYHGRTRECSILGGRDLPLGFTEENSYQQETAHIESGDMFILYTDGLTEVFSPEGEILGEARVMELVTSLGDRQVSEVVDGLRVLAEDFAGGREFRDDFTLAVVRVSDVGPHPPGTVERVLLLERENPNLNAVRLLVDRICSRANPDAEESFSVELKQAIQEVLTNVIRHSGESAKDTPVEVRFTGTTESIQVEVLHEGVPFEPREVHLPDLEDYPEGGFGLYIIHESVDLAQYGVVEDGRNVVRLIKWFPSKSGGGPSQG